MFKIIEDPRVHLSHHDMTMLHYFVADLSLVRMGGGTGSALVFNVVSKCSTTRARVADMTLPHSV